MKRKYIFSILLSTLLSLITACHSSQSTSTEENDDFPDVSFGDLAEEAENQISQSSKQYPPRLIHQELKESAILSNPVEDDDDNRSPLPLFLPLDLNSRNDSPFRQSKANVFLLRHFDLAQNQSEAPTTQPENDIESLLHEAHECMEGGEDEPVRNPRDFIKALMENYNFKKLFVNGYRWIQIKKSDPQYRDHALNVVYMLGLSHGLETLSGPLGMMFASQEGASSKTMALIGTVGAIVAIPGLDPLCLVLMSVYKSKKGFQTTITRFRTISHRSLQGISQFFLLPKFIESITQMNSATSLLKRRAANCKIDWNYGNKSTQGGNSQIRLFASIIQPHDVIVDFYRSGDSLIVQTVEFKNQILQLPPDQMRHSMKSFKTFYKINWHLGFTINELFAYLMHPSGPIPFYVSGLQKTDTYTKIKLTGEILKVSSSKSIRNPFCKRAL